jgi:hypothetical protein
MKGRHIAYRADELAFIQARQAESRQAIHAAFVIAFGRTDVAVTHIKALCTRMGWTSRAPYTPDEDAIIRARYADSPTEAVARAIGRTTRSVYHRARQLQLTKSAAFLASAQSGRLTPGDSRGASTRYAKGQTPANKGAKRPAGWAPGRMRETQFSAHAQSWNTQPIGAERIIGGYRWTKVRDERRVRWDQNWRQTHILSWESVHGPIPSGWCLKCLDSNRLNCDPSNWHLIERGVLPLINGGKGSRLSYDHAPEDLKPTVLAVAKLRRAAKQRRGQPA